MEEIVNNIKKLNNELEVLKKFNSVGLISQATWPDNLGGYMVAYVTRKDENNLHAQLSLQVFPNIDKTNDFLRSQQESNSNILPPLLFSASEFTNFKRNFPNYTLDVPTFLSELIEVINFNSIQVLKN